MLLIDHLSSILMVNYFYTRIIGNFLDFTFAYILDLYLPNLLYTYCLISYKLYVIKTNLFYCINPRGLFLYLAQACIASRLNCFTILFLENWLAAARINRHKWPRGIQSTRYKPVDPCYIIRFFLLILDLRKCKFESWLHICRWSNS